MSVFYINIGCLCVSFVIVSDIFVHKPIEFLADKSVTVSKSVG